MHSAFVSKLALLVSRLPKRLSYQDMDRPEVEVEVVEREVVDQCRNKVVSHLP